MGAFEHVITLLSFVYALAIGHVLMCLAGLIRAGGRVRYSWVHAGWLLTAFMVIMANWISFWDLRSLPSWGVGTVFFTFFMAAVNYLQAALVCPEVPDEGTIDLEQFHEEQGRRYIAAFLASGVLAVFANAVYGDVYQVMQWTAQNMAVVPMLAVALLAMAFPRARWIQLVAPFTLLALWAFYFVALQGAIH